MNLNVTMVAQAVTFFVFIFFCAKFIWPPLTNAIAARQKQVAKFSEIHVQLRQNTAEKAADAVLRIMDARHGRT